MRLKNELVIYQSDELTKVEVQIEDETVWLSQEQMAKLFGRNRVAITQHVGNIFKEGELVQEVVCKESLHTTLHGAIEGKKQVTKVKLYNLDVIISVGYRVKSKQGTQFRIWANQILKDYLLRGYSLNNRMNRIEDNGQVFDAFTFVADLIRSTKKSIDLVDNYVDDSVLVLLQKRSKGVAASIYTQSISKQLKLDIEKHNTQYPSVDVKIFKNAHDRFLIIDNAEVYHIGASIKDLGKKWFVFTKIEGFSKEIIAELKEGHNEH